MMLGIHDILSSGASRTAACGWTISDQPRSLFSLRQRWYFMVVGQRIKVKRDSVLGCLE